MPNVPNAFLAARHDPAHMPALPLRPLARLLRACALAPLRGMASAAVALGRAAEMAYSDPYAPRRDKRR